MKKIHIRKFVSGYITKNKWQFIIVFTCLTIGIFTGSIVSVLMNSSEADALNKYLGNFVSAYNLQSANNGEIFKFSVYNNIKIILFLWLSGIWIGFVPFGLLQVGIKGYKIGFSTTLFIKVFGIKGVFFALLSAIPQITIMIPSFMVYSVFNINFALFMQKSKHRNISSNVKNEMYIKNLICLLAAITISVFVSLIDAFVMPPILKPVCSALSN